MKPLFNDRYLAMVLHPSKESWQCHQAGRQLERIWAKYDLCALLLRLENVGKF